MTAAFRQLARTVYRALPMKRRAFELIRPLRAIPHGLYQHLHFKGPFEVEIDPAHSFRIQSYGTCVENELFWGGFGGSWESVSLQVWAALCRAREGLAIDVGANTGIYSLAAGALGRRVVAFEPVERMANRLRRNVALNPYPIEVVQAAVSDRSGRMPIYDAMTEHNYSASLEGQGPQAECYDVEVRTLDDFLTSSDAASVVAVKIDVERHEPSVIRGMANLIAGQQPPLLVEILDEGIGAEIQKQVGGLGYRVFHIDEQRGLLSASRAAPLGGHNWNHLFCTDEQFEQAGLRSLVAG